MPSASGTSRKRVSTALVSTVDAILAGTLRRGDRVAVALSGGVDSVVLLDLLARLKRRRGLRLSAVHVNHQLSPNARRWAVFCGRLCRARRVALTTVEVAVRRGNSIEAQARAARYAAFRALPVDHVVLAHNQDDQAETLLLQLLRGAGVKGLAAMPLARNPGGVRPRSAARRAGGPAILRPLLDVPRADILAYARARRLRWIEDESNDDTHFARNFLRHEILPRIGARFSAYRETLGRSARHMAEASTLLDQLAAADAGDEVVEGTLAVAVLERLDAARARNVLRWFLGRRGAAMPAAERLAEAVRQAVAARSDARVSVDLGRFALRRYGGALHLVPKAAPVPHAFERAWRGAARLTLPELGGTLTLTRGRAPGIDAARLAEAPVTVRVRRGGERLRLAPGGPRRSLKNLMQEAEIPPWVRDRLPLLYCGDALVWVPGIGIAAEYQAAAGRSALRPGWRAAAGETAPRAAVSTDA